MPDQHDASAAARLLRDESDRSVRWRLLVATSMIVLSGLLAALAPVALKGMVDAVAATTAPSHAMATYVALYLGALCAGRLLNELQFPLIGNAAQRFNVRLHQRFLEHLLSLKLSFHLRSGTGALMQTLQQAVLGYQLVFYSLLGSVVPVVVELVTVGIVLASLDQTSLLVTFAVTAAAYLLVLRHSAPPIQSSAKDVSAATLRVNGLLADCLLNVETLKCFVAESRAGERFAGATQVLQERWRALHRRRTRMGLAMTATFVVSVCTSLAISAHAVTAGTLTVGGFVLANLYILQVTRPLEMLGSAIRDLAQALGFIRPLLQVLREPGGDLPGGTQGVEQVRPPAVVFRDVRFAHDGDDPVLSGFSLTVPAGGSVALVGRSGSGKSSLARLLLRLHTPQEGDILLDGISIDDLPLGQLRGLIGFVSQDTALLDDTLAANIALGSPDASRREIEYAARAAHLHDFIGSLPEGYETRVGERGLRLSGGERQRVAIARAILKRPMVFIFDEATSMLDTLTEAAILRDLHEISEGCTTLVIAHRLATVKRCDQIAVLDAGRVIELGSHEALMHRQGTYAQLWSAQA